MTQFLRSLPLLAALLISCAMAPTARADGMAEAWIRAEGLKMGWDRGQRRFIVIGRSEVGSTPARRDYLDRRALAVSKALDDARSQIAQWLAASVETQAENRSELTQWVDGATADGIARCKSGFKANEDFRNLTKVCAQAAMVGFSPIQTFESASDIGATIEVACEYSLHFGEWARGKGRSVPPSVALEQWFGQIPDAQLCRTFGTRFVADQDGTVHLIAFGQAPVLGPGELADGACETARGLSTDLAAMAAGGITEANSLSSAMQSITAEGLGDSSLPEKYRSESGFRSAIKNSARLAKANIRCLSSRIAKDEATGRQVCVAACELTVQPAGAGAPNDGAAVPSTAASSGGCPSVPENMKNSIRQVQCEGRGVTLEAAVASALKAAIEREGVKVDADGLLRKQYETEMRQVGDEIEQKARGMSEQSSTVRTFSTGFVYSFELLSKREEAGTVTAQICANLVRFDPRNPRFGLPPTVALISTLGRPGEVKVGGQNESASGYLRIAEGALEPILDRDGRFIVIDERMRPALQRVRNDIAAQAERGQVPAIETLKLGQQLTADFILFIDLDRAGFTGSPGPRPQDITAGQQAFAQISARLVNVASGEVAWRNQASVMLKGRDLLLLRRTPDPAVEGLAPAEIAAHRAAEQLAEALAKMPKLQPAAPEASNASP